MSTCRFAFPLPRTLRSLRALPLILATVAAGACSDSDPVMPSPQETTEVGVVVSSTDIALTLFETATPSQGSTIGLGPDGSPVSLAVRGSTAAVPLGIVSAVAVVDLDAGEVTRAVALPEGSGATGAAFANDSIVVVGNSNLNTVSPVNVRSGEVGGQIPVGRFPTALVASNDRLFVINAELEDFVPAGPSTVTVIDRETLAVQTTIVLSGTNASAASIGAGGAMFVVNSGSFGEANGSLSVVDLASLTETSHHEGFGEFPGSVLAASPSRVLIGAFGVGALVWNPMTESFERGPDAPLTPGGVPSTSGMGMDASGRVYTLTPDCVDPGTAVRLVPSLADEVMIPVGVCPFAIGFTAIESGG